MRSRFYLACLGGLLLGPVTAVRAEPQVIERVAAVVNDEAIFLYDVRKRAIPFLAQVMAGATEDDRRTRLEELYAEILKQLIDEKLLQQLGQKMKVRVSRAEVDRAIRNVRAQSGLSESDFWQAIAGQGLSRDEYEADVRRQVMQLKVMNQRARGRVNISEREVRQRYEEKSARAKRRNRFRLSHLFLPGASGEELSSLVTKAEEIRQSINPENFEEFVTRYAGGDLGWLEESDLPPDLASTVAELAPGEISTPVKTSTGVHIVLLHERSTGIAGASFEQAKESIYRELVQQAMKRQETMILDELRREAVIRRYI